MLSTLFSSTYAPWRALALTSLATLVLGFRGNVSHSILAGVWLAVCFFTGLFSSKARLDARKLYFTGEASFLAFQQRGKAPLLNAFVLAGVPFALLALLNGRNITTFDNYGIQMTTASLLVHGTTDFSRISGHAKDGKIDCSHPAAYPLICREDGLRAATPAGVLPLSLPVFAIGRLFGADLTEHRIIWRLTKWTAAWCLAICTTLFFLVALRFGSLNAAAITTLFVGAGSEFISTIGQGLWSHDSLTLAGLVTLYGVFILAERRPKLAALLVGFGWSWMFASRLTAATWIAPMGLWVLAWRFRFGIVAGVWALVCFLPWALYYYWVYQHPLGPQMIAVTSTQGNVFSFANFGTALYGLLLSPGSGFLIYQPWSALLARWTKRKEPLPLSEFRGWPIAFAAMGILQYAFFATFYQWSGQHCWGPRYLTELVPLVGLATVPIIDDLRPSRLGRRVYWFLGGLAILIQLNGVLGPGREWVHRPLRPEDDVHQRVLDWSDPAFLYPLPRLFR